MTTTNMKITIAAFVSAILMVGINNTAFAAEVSVYDAGDTSYIIYDGQTTDGDYEKVVGAYHEIRESGDKNGGIILNGPGGLASEGEQIGQWVRNRGLTTMVLEGSYCVSACTSIWLGGETRVVFEGGKLGFHLPYIPASGFDAHPYEGAKNNYGWSAVLNYHNAMILESIAFDLSMGIANPAEYVAALIETSESVLWDADTAYEVEYILGGVYITK